MKDNRVSVSESLSPHEIESFKKRSDALKRIKYDGEHLEARFSVSTEVKIENLMKIEMKNNIKKNHCSIS